MIKVVCCCCCLSAFGLTGKQHQFSHQPCGRHPLRMRRRCHCRSAHIRPDSKEKNWLLNTNRQGASAAAATAAATTSRWVPYWRESRRRTTASPCRTSPWSTRCERARFGKIYRGDMMVDLAEGGYRSVSVMVRTLAMTANMRTQVDFWSDAERLSEIRHPNVTCLIGINHVEQPVCLVLECTSHSDLQEYLRANSDGDEEVRRSMLSPTIFISIAVQIGCGMEYLHGKGYVHRDLAARNILMADNGLVKVTLFGTITSGSHYTRPPGAVRSLPVRWSSPEVVFFERFSVHSDVWSFGVVLWEIYSYGVLPYYSYSDMEVIEMLRATRILTCPIECPAHVYSLMVQCWHKTPPSRPDFVEVHRQLRQLWAEFANLAAASQLIPTNRSSSSGNSQANMPTTSTSLTAGGIIGVHPVAQWLPEVPNNNIHMPLGAGLQHRYQKLPSTSNQPGSAQAKRNTPTASSASQKSSPASSTCNFKLNLYSTSNNAPPFAASTAEEQDRCITVQGVCAQNK